MNIQQSLTQLAGLQAEKKQLEAQYAQKNQEIAKIRSEVFGMDGDQFTLEGIVQLIKRIQDEPKDSQANQESKPVDGEQQEPTA